MNNINNKIKLWNLSKNDLTAETFENLPIGTLILTRDSFDYEYLQDYIEIFEKVSENRWRNLSQLEINGSSYGNYEDYASYDNYDVVEDFIYRDFVSIFYYPENVE